MEISPKEKFERWIVRPIKKLRELPDGDGACAALSISCGLYERFIDSRLKARGESAAPSAFIATAASDLGCDDKAMERFWNGFRLGLQHAFQPKAYVEKKGKGDSWGWEIAEADGYHEYPEIVQKDARAFIVRIDPWKFANHVVGRWREHPELMNVLAEFAFGKIERIDQSTRPAKAYGDAHLPQYKTLSAEPTVTGIANIDNEG